MCGRYTLFVDPADLETRFDAQFVEAFSPRYNAAPGQELPVIADVDASAIRRFEWGFIPPWADDDRNASINARAETLAEKPSFRDAYGQRGHGEEGEPTAGRCLVLADGFYEWTETPSGNRPYRIAYEDDRPFAMAGVWARWEPETTQTGLDAFGVETGVDGASGDDGAIETFAVVTTTPNELVAGLHDRMAAILPADRERAWLRGGDPGDLLESRSAEEMRAYPVSTAVNDPSNDDPSLVEPAGSP